MAEKPQPVHIFAEERENILMTLLFPPGLAFVHIGLAQTQVAAPQVSVLTDPAKPEPVRTKS